MEVVKADPDTSHPRPQALRLLEARDISQVAEIEREAFPTQWPPTSFRRELHDRLARYLVAWHPETTYDPEAEGGGMSAPAVEPPPWRWARALWRGLGRGQAPSPRTAELISGFVGVWFLVEEAHITSIAVRHRYHGRGIGELLLLGALELALARGCRCTTLEVRVSNAVAQGLYRKYGFQVDGVRKGYYSDNGEDAYVMTTPPLASPEFVRLFQERRQAFEQRYGLVQRVVT